MSQWWDTYGWAVTRIGPALLFILASIIMAAVSIRRRFRELKRNRQRGFDVLMPTRWAGPAALNQITALAA